MTEEEREAERRWVLNMVALEEERGPIVSGGVSARARRAISVALRVRENVRFLAYAVPTPRDPAE